MSSISKDIFDAKRDEIISWIERKLVDCTGESDGMLVDYISIMLSNGKSSLEVGEDLEALVGENVCKEIADSLEAYLNDLNGNASATANEPVQTTMAATESNDSSKGESVTPGEKKVISLKSKLGSSGLMTASLKTGRDGKSNSAKDSGTKNPPQGKKRSLADAALASALSSSRDGDRKGSGQTLDKKGSKIQRDENGGYVTKKNRDSIGGQGGQRGSAGNAGNSDGGAADKLAQMSGFANAQEMILFQQSQLLNIMQQQQVPPAHPYGGYRQQAFHPGRGQPFRGGGRGAYQGRGGPGLPNKGATKEDSTTTTAAIVNEASSTGENTVDSTATSSTQESKLDPNAPAFVSGSVQDGGASYGGRGMHGRGGRGRGRGYASYDTGGRYAGRGFGRGRGGRQPPQSAGGGRWQGGIFGSAGAGEVTMDGALPSAPTGVFTSAHKKWVREDTPSS